MHVTCYRTSLYSHVTFTWRMLKVWANPITFCLLCICKGNYSLRFLIGQVNTSTGPNQLAVFCCTNAHLWRNTCMLFWRAILDDVMSQSELTTIGLNYEKLLRILRPVRVCKKHCTIVCCVFRPANACLCMCSHGPKRQKTLENYEKSTFFIIS